MKEKREERRKGKKEKAMVDKRRECVSAQHMRASTITIIKFIILVIIVIILIILIILILILLIILIIIIIIIIIFYY